MINAQVGIFAIAATAAKSSSTGGDSHTVPGRVREVRCWEKFLWELNFFGRGLEVGRKPHFLIALIGQRMGRYRLVVEARTTTSVNRNWPAFAH